MDEGLLGELSFAIDYSDPTAVVSLLHDPRLYREPSAFLLNGLKTLENAIDKKANDPDWKNQRVGLCCRLFQKLDADHPAIADRQETLRLFEKNVKAIADRPDRERTDSYVQIDEVIGWDVFIAAHQTRRGHGPKSSEFYQAAKCFADLMDAVPGWTNTTRQALKIRAQFAAVGAD